MAETCGILTVNLRAIVRNWLRLRARVAPASCAAVVKADAYGLGMAPVARALQRAGCQYFFVATQAEGVALRQALGATPSIIVLGGARPGTEGELVAAGLWPSLYSVDAIARWSAAAAGAPCVVKFNSGMTRLGLDEQELVALLAQPSRTQALNVQMFMSHLACADEPAHPLNAVQLANFERQLPAVQAAWPKAEISLSNSSGIFLGAAWHFACVRPGAALYGVNPTPGQANPQEPVVRLALPVLQYRTLTQAASLGYSATAQGVAGQTLAVAMGGYADGLHRLMSGRGLGMLAGQQVPLLGRVSMDVTLFDVSQVAALPPIGEAYIDVLNDELTVSRVAETMGTIGYEVLTSLGQRYERRYVEEGSVAI